jgi:hypothetical protein
MTKQLSFYFGDFNEEKVIDTVSKQFQWLFDKDYPLEIEIHLGDEMDPFKSVYISYRHYNKETETYENELLEIIPITEEMDKLFDDFKGESALHLVEDIAYSKSIKIDTMLTNYLATVS